MFYDWISLYNPGCPQTLHVEYADLQPIEIDHKPFLLSAAITDVHCHAWLQELYGVNGKFLQTVDAEP